MLPTIPIPVWEQIAVVIVFAFLIAGLGWVLVRLFVQAIAEVNAHYARLIKDNNRQWQQYFDARAEAGIQVSTRMVERMDEMARALGKLSADLETRERLDLLDARRVRAPRKEQ